MLQIGAALFHYKLGQTLLQIGAASLLQIGASVFTNWGIYYKLGQPLLQNKAAITNWGKMYYKLGQVLQIRAIITNWGIAVCTEFSVGSKFHIYQWKINFSQFIFFDEYLKSNKIEYFIHAIKFEM